MDDGVSEDILTSEKGQSIQVKKLIPQVEKLRRESLPMSPLSLNGSLTNVDVCDTSFGKKVIKEMSSTNAEIPDESFSEEIFVNDTKCKKKSESTPNADMSSTSFSEELLQDMEYGLDALRDAVPVLCLKKNEESEDADIFEEMSAFQVMGIFNNKNSNRTAKSFNRKHEDQENELKNKRYFPDKNIDVLYKNEENKNPKSSEKLECTKLPGKKIGKCDDEVSDSMQDDETDINNNDNECSMESSETSANEYDWVQKIMLAGDDGDPNNNCQGNETPEGDCKMEESEEDDKELSTDQNHIKIKVKENNESESEEFIQPLLLSGNVVVNKDSCLNRNESEKKTIKDAMELDEHEDKCTESFRGTDQGELSDTSVINNLNDTMREIVADFIKQLPASSENFLIRVEPITECPMCYFQFNYQDFVFSTKTGAYIIDCTCGLTIYVIFEESVHLLKEYHSSSHSLDTSNRHRNVTSLYNELNVSSPIITESVKMSFNELNDCQLNKRKNRTRFIIFNDSDDDLLEGEDDSDDNYVP